MNNSDMDDFDNLGFDETTPPNETDYQNEEFDDESDDDEFEDMELKNPLSGVYMALLKTGCFSIDAIKQLDANRRPAKPLTPASKKQYQFYLSVGATFNGTNPEREITFNPAELPLCLERGVKKKVEIGTGLPLVQLFQAAGHTTVTYDLKEKTYTSSTGTLFIQNGPNGTVKTVTSDGDKFFSSHGNQSYEMELLVGNAHAGTKDLTKEQLEPLQKSLPYIVPLVETLLVRTKKLATKMSQILKPDEYATIVKAKTSTSSVHAMYPLAKINNDRLENLVAMFQKNFKAKNDKFGIESLLVGVDYFTMGVYKGAKPAPPFKKLNFDTGLKVLVAFEQLRSINPDASKTTRDLIPKPIGVVRKILNCASVFQRYPTSDKTSDAPKLQIHGVGTANIQFVDGLDADFYDIDPKADAPGVIKQDVLGPDAIYTDLDVVSDAQAGPEAADDYWRKIFGANERKRAQKDQTGNDYKVLYGSRLCRTFCFAHKAMTNGVGRWGGKMQFRELLNDHTKQVWDLLVASSQEYMVLIGEGGNPHNMEKFFIFLRRTDFKFSAKFPPFDSNVLARTLQLDVNYAVGVNLARLHSEITFNYTEYETPEALTKFRFITDRPAPYLLPDTMQTELKSVTFRNDKLGKAPTVQVRVDNDLEVEPTDVEAGDFTLNGWDHDTEKLAPPPVEIVVAFPPQELEVLVTH